MRERVSLGELFVRGPMRIEAALAQLCVSYKKRRSLALYIIVQYLSNRFCLSGTHEWPRSRSVLQNPGIRSIFSASLDARPLKGLDLRLLGMRVPVAFERIALHILNKMFPRRGYLVSCSGATMHIHRNISSYGSVSYVLRLRLPLSMYEKLSFDALAKKYRESELKGDISTLLDDYSVRVDFDFTEGEDEEWFNEEWAQEALAGIQEATLASSSGSSKISERIWGEDGSERLRLFISHKHEFRVVAHQIKEAMKPFGMTSFVAHDDIRGGDDSFERMKEALRSADAVLLIVAGDIYEGGWVNQEVGFALGIRVPILPLMTGKERPPAFVEKAQSYRGKLNSKGRLILKRPDGLGKMILGLQDLDDDAKQRAASASKKG